MMMCSERMASRVVSLIGLATVCGASTEALAQAVAGQSSGELQDIVVTAQRRSERLQDVPISVAAFTASQLDASGITSTADLPILTPGLEFGAQAGYSQPHLRGVGTVAGGPGVENPVALYVDDVYYGAIPGSILSLTSVSQIEVDKGPQGTLFGRNATGGLIQVTTKDPLQAFGGSAAVTYSNYATTGTDLYVTGGITHELAADLAVHFEHQGDGYGTNLVTGLPVSKTQELAVRNKWLLTADDTKVKVIFDFEQGHFIPNYNPAPGTTPLGAPPFTGGPQDAAGYFQPYGAFKQGGASVDIRHSFDFAHVVSISAYRQTWINLDGTASLAIDPTYAVLSDVTEQHAQITQEFQVLSLPDQRVQWTTGLFLYDADAGFTPPLRTTGGLIAPLAYLLNYSNQKSYSAALYGQATTEVAPATNLTVGLRYTAERRNFHGTETFGFPDGTSQEIDDRQHELFKKPTWRLVLDHHFTSDVMGYVSYNRGFKSGGYNDGTIPSVGYAPETLDAYELGAKTNFFDRHLSVNVSGFRYEYKNIQALLYLPTSQSFVYNGPEAKLYGLDLDAKLKVSDNLSMTAGLEYIHARYTTFPDAPISTPQPGGGTAYTTGSAAGNEMALTPTFMFSYTADYLVKMATFGDLDLSVSYAYNSGFFGEPDNRLHQPPYNLVNAQIAWTSTDELYKVRLWGRNLNDAQYTTALGSQPNGDFALFAPPRTYGITVSRNF
jgi:iron complex outermembrane receptor protein